MALRKRKYLNNRDLLSEIFKSKNSYSSYLNPEDAQYDIILDDLEKVNRNTISQARKNRADRIAKANWEAEAAVKKGVKQDQFAINHLDIPKTDVVLDPDRSIRNTRIDEATKRLELFGELYQRECLKRKIVSKTSF